MYNVFFFFWVQAIHLKKGSSYMDSLGALDLTFRVHKSCIELERKVISNAAIHSLESFHMYVFKLSFHFHIWARYMYVVVLSE